MSSEVRLLVVDREGNAKAPLPSATLKDCSWRLDGIGDGSFSINPLARGATEIQLWKREIQAWFDDELTWWGVPLNTSGGLDELTFNMEDPMTLFNKRGVDRATLDYPGVDQLAIGWDLLRYAQDETFQPNRDFNIGAANFGPSGKIRYRRYRRDEHRMILDCLGEFTTLADGFDWSLEIFGHGSRLWTPYFPEKGTVQKNLSIRIEQGRRPRGTTSITYEEDAVEMATHVYCTGGSDGDVKFEENYEDVAASAEYGVMQAFISEGSVTDPPWLEERARQEVLTRNHPAISPEVELPTTMVQRVDVPVSYLKRVKVGDWIPIKISYGYIQVDNQFRVYEVRWSEGDKVSLTFGEVR